MRPVTQHLVECVGGAWRRYRLSAGQLRLLREVEAGVPPFKSDLARLQLLWRQGLVARVYRPEGQGYAQNGWALTRRGAQRLTEASPRVSTETL